MIVVVFNNDVNSAYKKLKKKMFDEGVIRELRDRRFYEKPSEKKRRKRAESIRRIKKDSRIRRRELGF